MKRKKGEKPWPFLSKIKQEGLIKAWNYLIYSLEEVLLSDLWLSYNSKRRMLNRTIRRLLLHVLIHVKVLEWPYSMGWVLLLISHVKIAGLFNVWSEGNVSLRLDLNISSHTCSLEVEVCQYWQVLADQSN